jgi:signal transduction histidine kinase
LSLVFGLGVVAITGYLTQLETAYGWGNLTRMALHTCVGFVFLAIGFLALTWRDDITNETMVPSWLPVPIAIGGLTVTICFWQAIQSEYAVIAKQSNVLTELSYYLSSAFLIVGALLSFALTLSTYLAQIFFRRSRELEKAQEELIRKERLAVLGQLTATISHDIRSPLGTLRNAMFSIGEAINRNEMDRVGRSLKLAERNIDRCDRITNELLDFTRSWKIKPESTDIDRWLNSVLDEQEIPEDIECVRELNTGIVLPIDREYLRRAVINVVTNAVQALQDKNSRGNQLKVKSAVNGERLELSFIDTGPGIPEEIMEKIFEPLFSTKSVGTGLGMPIIKDIMEKHNGGVEFQSEMGKGTTVTLRLPIPKLEENDEANSNSY